MGSFAVKLFLRGVKAPIYLASPSYEVVSNTRLNCHGDAVALACIQTNGQPITIGIKDVMTIFGPEGQFVFSRPLTKDEASALWEAFDYGAGALEDHETIPAAAVKSARAWLDQMMGQFTDAAAMDQRGVTEDQTNARAWLDLGKIQKAIATAGPDFVAGWLAEAAFGPDVRVMLKNGGQGIISGFDDDESGHASQGRFAVDLLSVDEESHAYIRRETIGVGIDDIIGVITYDDDALRRGEVELLPWQD